MHWLSWQIPQITSKFTTDLHSLIHDAIHSPPKMGSISLNKALLFFPPFNVPGLILQHSFEFRGLQRFFSEKITVARYSRGYAKHWGNTVDGSEIQLTSWPGENIPFFFGFHTSLVVQDFFHQQYLKGNHLETDDWCFLGKKVSHFQTLRQHLGTKISKISGKSWWN